jgi:4a-hydroxytetrahydrobiopterin dehydratase
VSDLLSDGDVAAWLAAHPAWSADGGGLRVVVRCGDFSSAVRLLTRIAEVADARNHHPDVTISWETLTLTLTSHDAHGVTPRDLGLAEALEPLLAQPLDSGG